MCIRSQFSRRICDILVDETFIEDAHRGDAYDLLQHALESTFAHPLALARLLTKRAFVDEEVYGDCVKAIGRAVRGYAIFRKNHGDLFLPAPAPIDKPIMPTRRRKPAAIGKPVKRNAYRAPHGLRLARKHRIAAETRRKLMDDTAIATPVAPDRSLVRQFDKRVAAAVAAERAATLQPRAFPAGVVDFCAIRAARMQA